MLGLWLAFDTLCAGLLTGLVVFWRIVCHGGTVQLIFLFVGCVGFDDNTMLGVPSPTLLLHISALVAQCIVNVGLIVCRRWLFVSAACVAEDIVATVHVRC